MEEAITIALFTKYVRPELIILPAILYFIGTALRKSIFIKNCFIPIILGLCSLSLCAIYVLSVSPRPVRYQDVLGMIFDIIVQGIVCAATSVYAHQIVKQYLIMKSGADNVS